MISSRTEVDWVSILHSDMKTAMNNKIAANNGKSSSLKSTLRCESKSSRDEKPRGSSNSHFTEREWRRGWMLRSHRHSNTCCHNFNLLLLGPENRKYVWFFFLLFFPTYPSETWILPCVKAETHLFSVSQSRSPCRLFKYFIQWNMPCSLNVNDVYSCNGYQLVKACILLQCVWEILNFTLNKCFFSFFFVHFK